jgi:Mrp family chromosome partitioning ATPase
MTDCESCKSKDSCTSEEQAECEKDKFLVQTNEWNHIGKVIPIVSGKGGVGKSLMTALTATLMSRKGYKVGNVD